MMQRTIHSLTTILSTALCTLLAVGCMSDESESADLETKLTPAHLGLGDDWVEVEEGLWSRSGEDGAEEFAALGVSARDHALDSLGAVRAELAEIAADSPDEAILEEARMNLEELDAFLAELEGTEWTPEVDEVSLRCSVSEHITASATPIACGVAASSSAFYHHSCSSAGKSVQTYAKATCGWSTKTHSCGPKSGNPVSCYSSTSITGDGPCDSFAYASGPGWSTWKTNYQRGACGSPPLVDLCGGLCSSGKECICGTCMPPGSTCQ